jgi:hypothetical protein
VIAVIGFEVAVMRLMKMDQDGHYLADRQGSFSTPFDCSTVEQMLLQIGQKRSAEIIDMDKQFE